MGIKKNVKSARFCLLERKVIGAGSEVVLCLSNGVRKPATWVPGRRGRDLDL